MDDRDLAHMLLRDHITAAAALTPLQMRHLPEEVQTRVNDAIREGTAHIELRTRLDTSQTEFFLMRTDETEPLRLTRTASQA